MQELIVLGVVPGTEMYIPFYYWLIAAITFFCLIALRRKIVRILYRVSARVLAHRVDYSLRHNTYL
jgi:hypothetical protein